MSKNRKKVLDMLAEGKIDADEAERLMSVMEPPASTGATGPEPRTARDGPPKYLRVVVNEPDEQVNIRVPLGLIRAGMKLSSLIPSQAANGINKALKEKGMDIDVRSLPSDSLDELVDALADLEVEVKSATEQVHIYVE